MSKTARRRASLWKKERLVSPPARYREIAPRVVQNTHILLDGVPVPEANRLKQGPRSYSRSVSPKITIPRCRRRSALCGCARELLRLRDARRQRHPARKAGGLVRRRRRGDYSHEGTRDQHADRRPSHPRHEHIWLVCGRLNRSPYGLLLFSPGPFESGRLCR